LLYSFEEFCLDIDRRELRKGTALIAVEPQVFDLLAYLIRNRERVLSKDELIEAIWNGPAISDSAMSTTINAARSAIGDNGEEQRLIRTLPRKGFRFIGGVREGKTSFAYKPDDTAIVLPDKPSIAILAFTNMSGEAEHDYFADGMAEEIITALSRCS
jgi:DNA-binding winged helix-turn-helix (wHTH) protein